MEGGLVFGGYTNYSLDIRNLLSLFSQRKDYSFSCFKSVWKHQGFVVIHETKPEILTSQEYLQVLYSCVLGYFHVNKSISCRVGAIYTLYLLYETQRHSPKVNIIVSLGMFQELVRFVASDDVRKNKLFEMFQIFHNMKTAGCFVYSATLATLDGLSSSKSMASDLIQDININVDTVNNVIDVDTIDRLAKEYSLSKGIPKIENESTTPISVSGSQEIIQPSTPTTTSSMSIANEHLAQELHEILFKHNSEKLQKKLAQTLGVAVVPQNNGSSQQPRNKLPSSTSSKKSSKSDKSSISSFNTTTTTTTTLSPTMTSPDSPPVVGVIPRMVEERILDMPSLGNLAAAQVLPDNMVEEDDDADFASTLESQLEEQEASLDESSSAPAEEEPAKKKSKKQKEPKEPLSKRRKTKSKKEKAPPKPRKNAKKKT